MRTNTNHAKKLWLSLFAVVLPLLASAQTKVEIDGIWYNLIKGKVAEVTGGGFYYGSITIPATVTYDGAEYSVTSIGESAFENCSSLTTIKIPASVTSIGDWAFYDCSSLTTITIPEGVTSIGRSAFSGCSSLTAITIPESVTSIGYQAFYNCSSLTAITLPESVTSIGIRAFYNCSSLTAITIPESVTSIESETFAGCTSLTTITLPEGVTSIGERAFYQCSSLTAITLPNGVTRIESETFDGCSSLTAITLPENLTSINRSAFTGCSLERLTFNCTNVGRWFEGHSGIKEIIFSESVTSIGQNAFQYCTCLTSITFPESLTSIGSKAFSGCSSLTAVYISSIEAWCKITFENYNSNPLYYAHNLYLNGELVTNLVIPEGLTSIGSSAFESCTNFTAITLPESLTSIGDYAFERCSSLTSITLPEGVTSIGEYAFYNCRSLTAISIPESSQLTSIEDYVFAACINLTSINIPEGVTSIGNTAFYKCSSLTAINIPEGVTSIGDEAFQYCSSLTAITIPEGVTSIGGCAFEDCSSLTSIVLPKSMKTIGSKAFANCLELLDVYCYAEKVPMTEADAFNGSYPEYVTLHVPATALNTYKTTSPWSSFGKFETMSIAVTGITLSQSSATLTEGESLTLTATVAPNNADDQSISWSSSDPSIATVENTGNVIAIAPGTATITATANDGSGLSASCEVTVTPDSYVITYLIDGELFCTQTLTRGSAIILPNVPEKEGYTFSGWGEVPETMPAEDLTISGTYIINKYLVTFKIGDEVIASDSLEYGANIVAPEAPEKEGHTFSGWGDVAETVPANDVTYIAYYIANVYKVYYFVGSKLVNMVEVTYGEPIPEYIYEPEEGYTFLGWVGDTYETMPAHDVTYTANIESGINQITIDNGQLNIYDLMGRKVTDMENLTGGIYIINGRKVVVKIGM